MINSLLKLFGLILIVLLVNSCDTIKPDKVVEVPKPSKPEGISISGTWSWDITTTKNDPCYDTLTQPQDVDDFKDIGKGTYTIYNDASYVITSIQLEGKVFVGTSGNCLINIYSGKKVNIIPDNTKEISSYLSKAKILEYSEQANNDAVTVEVILVSELSVIVKEIYDKGGEYEYTRTVILTKE